MGVFIQNIRLGHYELGDEQTVDLRVPAAFDELVRSDQPRLTTSAAATAPNATAQAGPQHPFQALDPALAPRIKVRRGQLWQSFLGSPLDTLFQHRCPCLPSCVLSRLADPPLVIGLASDHGHDARR
jgi:hypothetical protein